MLAQVGSPLLGARYLAAFNEEVDMPLDTTYARIFLVGSFVCNQGASLSVDVVPALMPWLT